MTTLCVGASSLHGLVIRDFELLIPYFVQGIELLLPQDSRAKQQHTVFLVSWRIDHPANPDLEVGEPCYILEVLQYRAG